MRVIRDTHNDGIELTDQLCMTALQIRAGLVERLARDKMNWTMIRVVENGYEKACNGPGAHGLGEI